MPCTTTRSPPSLDRLTASLPGALPGGSFSTFWSLGVVWRRPASANVLYSGIQFVWCTISAVSHSPHCLTLRLHLSAQQHGKQFCEHLVPYWSDFVAAYLILNIPDPILGLLSLALQISVVILLIIIFAPRRLSRKSGIDLLAE